MLKKSPDVAVIAITKKCLKNGEFFQNQKYFLVFLLCYILPFNDEDVKHFGSIHNFNSLNFMAKERRHKLSERHKLSMPTEYDNMPDIYDNIRGTVDGNILGT